MRQIEGNPAEAEDALRAVLQVMALEPSGQLALFPEPEECVTCRISFQYEEMLDRYRKAPFFRGLDKARATVLKRVETSATQAGEVPCHEPERLEGPGFAALRREATEALETFGWTPGDPDPAFLCGRSEYAERWWAEEARLKQQRRASHVKGSAGDEFSDIPEFDPRGLTVAAFRERLDRVPWFAHLGRPHPRDRFVERIKDWSEWGGPEALGNSPIGAESGRWQEGLLALAAPGAAAIESCWSSVENQAFARMPVGPTVDPWHGPTSASTHGAWVAATVACCLLAEVPIPRNALRQWAWFARGHWPCGYSEDDDLPLDDNGDFVQEALEKARLVVL